MIEKTAITATHINYFFICKKKLWLFMHQINMEQESDIVKMGKLIHESSYDRKVKEIKIGENIVLDHMDVKSKTIHEVKKSNKMESAHKWQLKYYLYCLREHGINDFKGQLDYPKLKKTQTVALTEDDIVEIEKVIRDIEKIFTGDIPKAEKKKACRKCAYFEYCFL
ncbi:MAG: CRISPR-associated protein Cas4 [bacterium]